jgi:CRISPR-associated protein (TIGR03986 family)
MSEEFLNPYQFIPVTGKISAKKDQIMEENTSISAAGYDDFPNSRIRHDYWQKQSYSGRMVCEIELITPTIVGRIQEPDKINKNGPSKVIAYTVGNKPAIPANSIRGMVSSVAETLSQSALRVLSRSNYSVRKIPKSGLSAIGRLIAPNGKGQTQWQLMPLCLPTIHLKNNHLKIPEKWKKMFSTDTEIGDWLSAYIDGYGYVHDKTRASVEDGSTLELLNPSCYHSKQSEFYYAKLHKIDLTLGNIIITNTDGLHRKQINEKNNEYLLLGQKLRDVKKNPILTQAEFKAIKDENEQLQYTRGIIFCLGIEGRETEIPDTKTHEKFIPCPQSKTYKDKTLSIDDKVLKNFTAIAKQCAEESKGKTPFLPRGYGEYKYEKKINYWELTDGELVYFDLDTNGDVCEISYSAIWRKKINGDSYTAFANINPDLLPWGSELSNQPENTADNSTNQNNQTTIRSKLSPAEAIFGVVAANKLNSEIEPKNLASRVRFSDATPLKDVECLKNKTLKILASPKPPSPCLYFHGKNGYIAKNALDLTSGDHQPRGRKVYLHHRESDIKNETWAEKVPQVPETGEPNYKQNLKCELIMKKGEKLYFHLDFNNLSWEELSLLEKSIHPDEKFCHRLGLGKPLGLGSVKLKICGIFLIDRTERYKKLSQPRYTRAYAIDHWSAELKERYPLENSAVENSINTPIVYSDKLIDQETLNYLCQVGNPENTKHQVTYPFSQKTNNQTPKHYEWFVENDKRNNSKNNANVSPQTLQVLKEGGDLPTLKSN